MIDWKTILTVIKYVAGIILLCIMILAPVWVATQNKRTKQGMIFTRILSWLFGWTGIGWLLSLFVASRK